MPVILSHPENRQWNAEPNHCVVGANREYPQLLWQRTLAAVICGRVFPAAESRGSMPDSSSAIMEGAKVTLANTCTTEKRAMNTSAEGGYRFARLIPGTSVEKPSSTGARGIRFRLRWRAAVAIDVAMQVRTWRNLWLWSDRAHFLNGECVHARRVQGPAVEELPLNDHNMLNLVTLVPGVVIQGGTMASLTERNVFSAGSSEFGGGTANQIDTLFDRRPGTVSYGHGQITTQVESAAPDSG